ncbi:hypothetical protein LXA43DRAFT_879141, partial [Ganoderma leucocontextum]
MSSQPTQSGVRTSNEVAGTDQTGAPRQDPVELEASGELPHSFFIPPAEPGITWARPASPRDVSSDLALAVKWGLAEYGRIREEEQGRRVTRTLTRAIKSRGTDGAQATPGAHAGQDVSRVSQNTAMYMAADSGITSAVPATPETALSSESDTSLEGGYGGDMELVLRRLCGDSTGSQDGGYTELVLRRLNGDSAASRDWTMVTYETGRELQVPQSIAAAQEQGSASWVDLCEAEDQLGPLPASWNIDTSIVPILPKVDNIHSSLADEFWRDYDTSASEHEEDDLQQAIAASIASAQADARGRELDGDMSAMAVIVEIVEDSKRVKPEGHDGHFTSHQKAKDVPRTSEQREFLRSYTRGDSAPPPPLPNAAQRARTASVPKPGPQRPTPGPHGPIPPVDQPLPSQYRREKSQLPEGGWYGATPAAGAGGRGGGGQGPPSSPSGTDSSDDESHSSS